MTEFADLERIRRMERRAVLATVVGMHGTSPRKEGARMWVGESGSILGSVTIGGCVDAEVLRAAPDVLAASSPSLMNVEIGDDDALVMGLTCAGSVDILVRPVTLDDEADRLLEAWKKVETHAAGGGRGVIAMPVPDEAMPAEGADQVLVVLDDGTTWGTLGDPVVDAQAVIEAADRLRRGGSRVVDLKVQDTGVPVYFEVHGRGPLLAIVGGSAVADPLASMASLLGMHTVVIEGRERFASAERFPHADEVVSGLPSRVLEGMHFDASSAIVVVAHDYKFDVPVLERAVTTDAGYIGMLGSRRRAAAMFSILEERGMAAEALSRIRAPIGLDIGGQTAAEIALSILAEIWAVRNGRSGGPMRDRTGGPGRTAGSQPQTPPAG